MGPGQHTHFTGDGTNLFEGTSIYATAFCDRKVSHNAPLKRMKDLLNLFFLTGIAISKGRYHIGFDTLQCVTAFELFRNLYGLLDPLSSKVFYLFRQCLVYFTDRKGALWQTHSLLEFDLQIDDWL